MYGSIQVAIMKYLLTFLFCLIAVVSYSASLIGSGVVVSSGTCTASTTLVQTHDDGYYSLYPDDYDNAQRLKISDSTTVCQVDIKLSANQAVDFKMAFYDSSNRSTGNIIGTASNSVTTTISDTYPYGATTYSFTWATNPTVTSDCWMHIYKSSGTGSDIVIRIAGNGNSDYYEDLNYNYYRDSSDRSTDWVFLVYTQ